MGLYPVTMVLQYTNNTQNNIQHTKLQTHKACVLHTLKTQNELHIYTKQQYTEWQ
jgi:hypothetical protein